MKIPQREICKRFFDGTCSTDELEEVAAWTKASEENARQLFRWEQLYHLGRLDPEVVSAKKERAEERLRARIAAEEGRMLRRRRMRSVMQYAAGILLAIGVVTGVRYWHTAPDRELLAVSADAASTREVALPDGTHVWLNRATTLRYPRNFTGKNREVFLSGEAYFEVAKNPQQPFIVRGQAMAVRVLGTIFNFKTEKNARTSEVALLEGEVEVRNNAGDGLVILEPGQRAELNRTTGRLTVKQVNTELDAVWHSGLIPFETSSMAEIADVLEQLYDVNINLSQAIDTEITYSGMIKRQGDIEAALKSLQNVVPMRYTISGRNVYIDAPTE